MSTISEPGPFDALEKVAPTEPIFPLVAHDPLAAALVRQWAHDRRAAIVKDDTIDDEKRRLELLQVREAEDIADAMDEWRAGEAERAPDQPETPKPTYSGNSMTEVELAAKERHDRRKAMASKLNNAVAEIVEVADMLADNDPNPMYPTYGEAVRTAAKTIANISHRIRPKRRSYAHLAEGGGDE